MTRFQGEKSKEKIRIIYPYSPLFSYVFIFFPCSDAAADMPLAEIFIQHFAHPRAERGIEFAQPFGDVLVYGGFACAKMRRASAHRATRRQYVLRVRTHALINIFPHLKSPPTVSFRLSAAATPRFAVWFNLCRSLHFYVLYIAKLRRRLKTRFQSAPHNGCFSHALKPGKVVK